MSKQLEGLAWGGGGGTEAKETPLLEIKGTGYHWWASSSAAGSGSTSILSNAAAIEMRLDRIAVFTYKVSRQGALSSKGMFLKEPLI